VTVLPPESIARIPFPATLHAVIRAIAHGEDILVVKSFVTVCKTRPLVAHNSPKGNSQDSQVTRAYASVYLLWK